MRNAGAEATPSVSKKRKNFVEGGRVRQHQSCFFTKSRCVNLGTTVTCRTGTLSRGTSTEPCFSQAGCANYDAEFGEPCCLATRYICGSTADAGGCAIFGPGVGTFILLRE
jgi:hypothetical protein